jgi:hypothetical protein
MNPIKEAIMKITIECTAAEQAEIKRNLKINQSDTEITYTQAIHDNPEDMTCGEYALGLIDWNINK